MAQQAMAQPVATYVKDDFFDSMSCEALERQAMAQQSRGRSRFHEQRKLDMDTFGAAGGRAALTTAAVAEAAAAAAAAAAGAAGAAMAAVAVVATTVGSNRPAVADAADAADADATETRE